MIVNNEQKLITNNFNHLVRCMEYFEDNREEMFPLVEGFMSSIETMLLHGKAGSGKSLFTYSLVKALASDDGEFLGVPCAKGLKVLFCDGEMHNNTIADRAEVLGKHQNLHYIATTDAIKVDERAINLSDSDDRDKLINTIRDGGYKVVVFDSVRTLWSMEDENSAGDWHSLNDLLVILRQLNCAVIFIHHNNKTGNYSGSSNAETYVDRTCSIEKAGEGMWTLKVGDKTGRDKMGWSEDVKSLCWKVGEHGLEAVDSLAVKLERLESCFDWLSHHLSDTDAKDRVRYFNKVLGLSVGNNPTLKNLYENAKDLFEAYGDNKDLAMTSKVFKELMNGQHYQFDIFNDNDRRVFNES